MKAVSLFLSLCFTFNVLASSGSVTALEETFDNYQYAMTVEWDQKDKIFYEAQTEAFMKDVKEIIKSEALTKEEVISFVERRVQNKKSLEVLKIKMSQMSSEEILSALKNSPSAFYSQGANWSGMTSTLLIGGVIVLFVLAFLSIESKEDPSDCGSYNGNCYDY